MQGYGPMRNFTVSKYCRTQGEYESLLELRNFCFRSESPTPLRKQPRPCLNIASGGGEFVSHGVEIWNEGADGFGG